MKNSDNLKPAKQLAKKNDAHFPNESEEYRKARNVLLAEEIELRRIWRVADMPAYTVFMREDDKIRHFYSAEGNMQMTDPGQDPHNAPDMNPLWIILDTTPGGRGSDWYPTLDD